MDWQTEIVDNYAETINDHVYVGPHKWIVCLIGSNGCATGTFMSSNESVFRNMPNLSISVMCLSERPIARRLAYDYRKLALSSAEGTFCNKIDISD